MIYRHSASILIESTLDELRGGKQAKVTVPGADELNAQWQAAGG